ncbi:MAG: helix-turn-helix domain-containing protein [Treponema sp.]|nr:helix-turn-helix domain-containing protein [Treponema sp.]
MTVTAKKLGIHKTTLGYRMQRIRERFGINLDDPYILTHLYISYLILELEPKD